MRYEMLGCAVAILLSAVSRRDGFRTSHYTVARLCYHCTSPQRSRVAHPAQPAAQGQHQHCQAALLNITKLQQLGLEWNGDACSGDVRISGRTIQKVSEVYGDYSTVLATKGACSDCLHVAQRPFAQPGAFLPHSMIV